MGILIDLEKVLIRLILPFELVGEVVALFELLLFVLLGIVVVFDILILLKFDNIAPLKLTFWVKYLINFKNLRLI